MFGLPAGIGTFKKNTNAGTQLYSLVSTFFDGTNNFVDLGTPADLTLNLATTEVSIGAWVNVTDLSANRYVIAKALPFVPEIGYILGIGTSGQLFGYFGHTTNTSSPNNSIVVNTWYHVGYRVALNAGVCTRQFMDKWSPGR